MVRFWQIAALSGAIALVSGCGQAVSTETLGSTRTTEAAVTADPAPVITNASPTTTATAPAITSSTGVPATTGSLKVLDVVVWDDTISNPPGGVEVLVDGQSWFPDLTYGADGNQLGNFQVGVEAEFMVYPDGRGGIEIRVPFLMTEEIISGSDRDRISVSIEDDKVTAFGTPIVGLEIEFNR